MKRITFHLSGVKKFLTEDKKTGKNKSIIINTISHIIKNEEEGLAFMSQYLTNNKDVSVTKYYFSNVY